MKTFIVLALCVSTALAGYEEDLWLQFNKVRPVGLDVEEPVYEGRIVGGNEVDIANFPYQLSLRHNGNHMCGASVISSNWALSAAHCTDKPITIASASLRAGSTSRLTGGLIFAVAQIVNHQNYTLNTIDYDVSVLRPTSSFVGTHIAAIPLVPTGTSFVAGTRSVVSGWGLTSPGGSLSDNLRAVDIPVVSLASCRNSWGASRITDRMICAGELGRDSCSTDSGGPLVTGGRQFGIVSWGATECGGSMPGVYADVGNVDIRSFISYWTGI